MKEREHLGKTSEGKEKKRRRDECIGKVKSEKRKRNGGDERREGKGKQVRKRRVG